jgi:hypothetical protein
MMLVIDLSYLRLRRAPLISSLKLVTISTYIMYGKVNLDASTKTLTQYKKVGIA